MSSTSIEGVADLLLGHGLDGDADIVLPGGVGDPPEHVRDPPDACVPRRIAGDIDAWMGDDGLRAQAPRHGDRVESACQRALPGAFDGRGWVAVETVGRVSRPELDILVLQNYIENTVPIPRQRVIALERIDVERVDGAHQLAHIIGHESVQMIVELGKCATYRRSICSFEQFPRA